MGKPVARDEIPLQPQVLVEPFGGHFSDKRIAYKVLRLGYYCPTLFRDAKKYVRSCDN